MSAREPLNHVLTEAALLDGGLADLGIWFGDHFPSED